MSGVAARPWYVWLISVPPGMALPASILLVLCLALRRPRHAELRG